jgi:hypothetical protein
MCFLARIEEPMLRSVLEGELHRKLNDPRTRAEGEHFSKIDGADIANGIVSVRVIQKVEKVRTELKGCPLADRKPPGNRKNHVLLTWSAQNVSTHVADINATPGRWIDDG